METVTDFILGGSKITVDGECSHEIKRHLLLGRKIMTNLDSLLKSRDIANQGTSNQWFFKKPLIQTFKASKSYGFSSSHVWM